MKLIYLGLSLIGIFAFGMVFIWLKEYILRNNRKEDGKEKFLECFVNEGVSESLALSVYRHLQDWTNFSDFPVRPQDNIADIYGIVEEDLDDLIIEIAEANNLEILQTPIIGKSRWLPSKI